MKDISPRKYVVLTNFENEAARKLNEYFPRLSRVL